MHIKREMTASHAVTPLPLPNAEALETRAVLKKLAEAHRYLAELKGVAASIPNESILINTLTLQEAKDSSEIENIITTQDEIFRAELLDGEAQGAAAKEVRNYAEALKLGFSKVRDTGLIRQSDILAIQQIIEENNAGLRKLPGTALKNQKTGEVIYTPPQNPNEVEQLVTNLIFYINDDETCDLDPLLKMAIAHHQFESIHPFYDGNGRTGRILNILYLVAKDLLNLPVLYLSRFITQNKPGYYEQLQQVRETGDWEPWALYMLNAVAETSRDTITLIHEIKKLMQQYKTGMRKKLPKIYRQELLNNLFNHPYTKIEFVMDDLQVSRITATKYLEQLVEQGFVEKERVGRSNFYINQPLFALLSESSQKVSLTRQQSKYS